MTNTINELELTWRSKKKKKNDKIKSPHTLICAKFVGSTLKSFVYKWLALIE